MNSGSVPLSQPTTVPSPMEAVVDSSFATDASPAGLAISAAPPMAADLSSAVRPPRISLMSPAVDASSAESMMKATKKPSWEKNREDLNNCDKHFDTVTEQCTRYKKDRPSPLTPSRIPAHDEFRFSWDQEARATSQENEDDATWWSNFKDYQKYQGSGSADAAVLHRNPGLWSWARRQRHQYDAPHRRVVAIRSMMTSGEEHSSDDLPSRDMPPASPPAASAPLANPSASSTSTSLKHSRPDDDGEEGYAGRKIRCTERKEQNTTRTHCRRQVSSGEEDRQQLRAPQSQHPAYQAVLATPVARRDAVANLGTPLRTGEPRIQLQDERSFRGLVIRGEWSAVMDRLRDDTAALRMSAVISFNPIYQVAGHQNVPPAVVQRMMECGAGEVLLADKNAMGENSFHSIVCTDVLDPQRNSLIEHVLNASPILVAATNEYGSSTLDIFADAWDKFTLDPPNGQHDVVDVEDGFLNVDLRQALATRPLARDQLSKNLRIVWERYEILLRAERRRAERGNHTAEESIFMCAVGSHVPVPTSALQLALALSPQAESEQDAQGRVPLAIAAKNAPLWSARRRRPRESNALLPSRAIRLIVGAFRETAMVMDFEGRLPIHVGIEHGLCWMEGLELIVRDFPEALYRPDPMNVLYPFAYVASCSHERRRGNSGNGFDLEVVETMYHMLREAPFLVDPSQET